MYLKALNKLALAVSLLAAASGAQAGAITDANQDGAAPFAAPGILTISASAISMLHGAASYLDSFSLLTAYQNVSGGGLQVVAAANPWDGAHSFVGDFSNAPMVEIALPAPDAFPAPGLTEPVLAPAPEAPAPDLAARVPPPPRPPVPDPDAPARPPPSAPPATAIAEPSPFALLGAALGVLLLVRRRHK